MQERQRLKGWSKDPKCRVLKESQHLVSDCALLPNLGLSMSIKLLSG